MSWTALWRLSSVALAAGTSEPASLTVVLTGISLVFLILLILIGIILIQGKIFSSLDKKKEEKANAAPQAAPVLPVAPKAAAPVVEDGIPPEVVAAIVAAVSAATDGAFTLRAVTTAKQGRGSWGLAGVIDSTQPF